MDLTGMVKCMWESSVRLRREKVEETVVNGITEPTPVAEFKLDNIFIFFQ